MNLINLVDVFFAERFKTSIETIKKTVSGAIATFETVFKKRLVSLEVDMEPIQDLHGQDAPYPGGGGKNKIPYPYPTQSTTIDGVTFTVDADGTVTVNGTPNTSNVFMHIIGNHQNEFNGYVLNGCPSNGGTSKYKLQYYDDTAGRGYDDVGDGITIGAPNGNTCRLVILIYYGYQANNLVFKPMIRPSSVSDSTFAPYSNICPISGRSEVGVWRSGKNLLENASDSYSISGTTYHEYACPLSLLEGETVTFSLVTANMQGKRIALYKGRNANNVIKVGEYGENHLTATLSGVSGYDAIRMYLQEYTGDAVSVSGAQLEIGSTATAYEAPNIQQITVQLGQTVYGGTVDAVSGVMTVDRAMVDLGTLTWAVANASANLFQTDGITDMKIPSARNAAGIVSSAFKISSTTSLNTDMDDYSMLRATNLARLYIRDTSHSDAATFKAAMSGVQLCYELATPVTVQLTGQQLMTLKGINNVWSDADSVTVVYKTKNDTQA